MASLSTVRIEDGGTLTAAMSCHFDVCGVKLYFWGLGKVVVIVLAFTELIVWRQKGYGCTMRYQYYDAGRQIGWSICTSFMCYLVICPKTTLSFVDHVLEQCLCL